MVKVTQRGVHLLFVNYWRALTTITLVNFCIDPTTTGPIYFNILKGQQWSSMDCNMDWYCRGLCNVECIILPSTQLKNVNYYHYAVISKTSPPQCSAIKSSPTPKTSHPSDLSTLERSLEWFHLFCRTVRYYLLCRRVRWWFARCINNTVCSTVITGDRFRAK